MKPELIITHTRIDGTLIDGTSRGDGTAEILKAAGWRWSRNLGTWYVPHSRDRSPKQWIIDTAVAGLTAADFIVTTEIDDTARPAAEVEADRAVRADERAAALAAKADRKERDARAAEARMHRADALVPPGGEPIKVGHHSEKRHRRSIERAWSALGASVEADKDAQRADERATIAASANDRRSSPRTVANRIDKLGAELRQIDRRIDGYQQNIGGFIESAGPATGDRRERLLTDRGELVDQLDYWSTIRAEQVAAGQATNYGPDMINVGDQVEIFRDEWARVTRVNGKTVRAVNRFGGTGLIPYHQLLGHMPCSEDDA